MSKLAFCFVNIFLDRLLVNLFLKDCKLVNSVLSVKIRAIN